jgi:hypothetical protein
MFFHSWELFYENSLAGEYFIAARIKILQYESRNIRGYSS